MTRRSGWLLALALAAPAYGAGEDPPQLLKSLEARMIAARHVLVDAQIEVRGALAASLTGRVELFERNRAHAEYRGQFAGAPAALVLDADSRLTQLRSGDGEKVELTGAESNRALIVALVRWGVAPDIVRLHDLQVPDHAGGGIERWLTLDAFRPTTYVLGGDLEGTMAFGFDAEASNGTSTVRLWVDPDSGLPRRRQVTLRLPHGEATVVEDYPRFVVE